MLKLTKPNQNRIDIDLSGSLNAQTMNEGLDELIEMAQGISQGRMLYTIGDFEMPTLGALAVEFKHMPELVALLGKFDRCAVLCDRAWVRAVAMVEGAIIPSLEIKGFALSERRLAEDWLNASIETEEDEDENFPV